MIIHCKLLVPADTKHSTFGTHKAWSIGTTDFDLCLPLFWLLVWTDINNQQVSKYSSIWQVVFKWGNFQLRVVEIWQDCMVCFIWADINLNMGWHYQAGWHQSQSCANCLENPANILPFIPFVMGGFGKSLYKKYLVYSRIACFGGKGEGAM